MDKKNLNKKIEEYYNEIEKLEKQKIEYLEVDKIPPNRIEKRIWECKCIATYLENLILELEKSELEITLARSLPVPLIRPFL